jgi:hypothetical protein
MSVAAGNTAVRFPQCFAGAGGQRLQECGMADGQLVHIARREYVLACNWKVFCDNYLVRCACVRLAHVGHEMNQWLLDAVQHAAATLRQLELTVVLQQSIA